jgi:hypothetical protein
MTPEFWLGFEKQAVAGKFLSSIGDAAKKFISQHGVESALGSKNTERLVHGVGEKTPALGSFIGWPVSWASKKILGEKLHNRIGSSVNKGILNLDTMAGKPLDTLASKLSLTKNLFKQEEHIPFGKDVYKKVQRPSIMAPLGAARDIAVPMIASSAMYAALQKRKDAAKAKEESKQ